jgi:hypothetical protein
MTISVSKYSTLNYSSGVYESLIKHLNQCVEEAKTSASELEDSIEKARKKLKIYSEKSLVVETQDL